MRILSLLYLFGVFIFFQSCEKEKNIELPLKTYLIRLYKNNEIKNEFIYDEEYKLLKGVNYGYYPSNTYYIDSIIYNYKNNKIDTALEYLSYYKKPIQNLFLYDEDNNLISLAHLYSGGYHKAYFYYNDKNQIIKIVDYIDEAFEYDEFGNIIVVHRFLNEPYVISWDSLQYDNKKNPFKNFWMYDQDRHRILPRFISQNNIIWRKSYFEVHEDYTEISESIYKYEYTYNKDDLPISMIEYTLKNIDTIGTSIVDKGIDTTYY